MSQFHRKTLTRFAALILVFLIASCAANKPVRTGGGYGTNSIGVYMGMIAVWDGWTNEYNLQGQRKQPPYQGIMMFSATSGQLLRWISANEFSNVYILKNKPEYPAGD